MYLREVFWLKKEYKKLEAKLDDAYAEDFFIKKSVYIDFYVCL